MENSLDPAVIEALSSLTTEQQLELIARAKDLSRPGSLADQAEIWSRLAGSMSREEADAMARTIEEGCDRVNHDAW